MCRFWTKMFGLANEELALIPEFIDRPNVLGIGEIGLNKNIHIDLAARHDQLILVHTPHLEDKLKGMRLTRYALRNHPAIKPERVKFPIIVPSLAMQMQLP